MHEDEVIRDLLTKAPPAAPGSADLRGGEKAIDQARVGSVDVGLVTGWVTRNGGREVVAGGDPGAGPYWVVPESALDL